MTPTCFFARGQLRVGWVEEWTIQQTIRKMFDEIDQRYAQLTEKP